MRHHKTDIGDRTADIADRETRSGQKRAGKKNLRWTKTWLAIYSSVLLEFHCN